MRQAKRWIAMILVLSMILSIMPMAFAADPFAKSKQWTAGQFTDVAESDWYYDTVKGAYELGLMNGDTVGTFRPKGQVTLAETVTVAARIHSIAETGTENFVQGDPWYGVYVAYALENGILTQALTDYTKPATRLQFAEILSRALPEEDLEAINTVEDGAIPDVAGNAAVYLLYRAGILTGSDELGTFHPTSNIKRSEVAAIVSRMALPDLREEVTLTLQPEEEGPSTTPVKPVEPDNDFPTPEEVIDPENQVPFDQQYPDLINDGTIDFSGDRLMVKFEEDPGLILQGRLALKGVTKLEKLFDAVNGVWYLAYTDSNVTDVLEGVREIGKVLVAEYDYAYTTDATIVDADSVEVEVQGNKQVEDQWYLKSCGIQNGLGHLKHNHHHNHGKDKPCPGAGCTGDENIGIAGEGIVVAVIDTGVDYNHEDLKDNIWVNADEIPDNGIDDDNNGYVDDYYGVDMVARKGSGNDDNGHGTHVAGIIAAANNNLGVVGIAYNATIMPVKAGQSSGYFNQSDIAKAIIYAYENGADVINMSFGGSASTIAVEDALTLAYTNCVLVAAAGNDGYPNEDYPGNKLPVLPSYPAAYAYVLGVMSVNEYGVESSFTNYDVKAFNSVEYELYAPGEAMLSTIPNNKYASWNGTSMAAPVVSAMAALVRAQYYDRDTYPTKFIAGQLAATGDTNATCLDPKAHGDHNLPKIADLELALGQLPEPNVGVSDYVFFDTVGLKGNSKNNGDGVIDAGETIALGFTLRNQWGKTGETIVSVDTLTQGGVTDPYVKILNNNVNYGSVGTYSTQDAGQIKDDEGVFVGWEKPIYLKISENCPDDYIIALNITVTSTNGLNESDTARYVAEGSINLDVRRGVVLPNVIKEDMILTSDQMYIIPNSTMIMEGATVTVQPGTQIQFWSNDANDAYATSAITYLKVAGTLLLNGTPEDPIELFPSERMSQYRVEIQEAEGGHVVMKYANVVNPYLTGISYAEGCEFTQNYRGQDIYYRSLSGSTVKTYSTYGQIAIGQAKDCAFYKLGGSSDYSSYQLYGSFDGCIFVDSAVSRESGNFENSVFYGNNNYLDESKGTVTSLTINSQPGWKSNNKVSTNPETGTTYARVYAGGYAAAADFAEQLGGHVAIIETEDEWNYVKSALWSGYNNSYSHDYCLVGLRWDAETQSAAWADGSKVDDFISPKAPVSYGGDYIGCIYLYDRSVTWYSDTAQGYYLIELPAQYVEDITLNRYAVTLDPQGEGWQISAETAPSSLIDPQLIYESQDTNVATVTEDGLVKAVAPGTTEIRVYSPDKYVYNTLKVTVVGEVLLTGIDAGEDFNLPINTSQQLKPVLTPENTSKQYLTYTSSDTSVATVTSGGLVKGHSVGEAVITVTNPETGLSDTVTVRVIIPVTEVTAEDNIVMLSLDGEEEAPDVALGVTILPEDATDKVLVWESSNPEILDVDENGQLVKGSEPGFATLRATAEGTEHYAEVVVFLSDRTPEATVVQMQEFDDYYGHYIFALLDDGTLWYWGDTVLTPQMLPFEDVRQFMFGYNPPNQQWRYLYILDSTGTLRRYGGYNVLSGLGSEDNSFNGGVPMTNVKKICCDDGDTYYALRFDGSVYAWGDNQYGQLGDGSKNDSTKAYQMNISNIQDIAVGTNFVFLLDDSNDVWGFGNGTTSAVQIATDVIQIYPWTISGDSIRVTIEYSDRIEYWSSITDMQDHFKPLGEWNKAGRFLHFYIENNVLYAVQKVSGYYGQTGTGYNSMHSGYEPVLKVRNVSDIFMSDYTTYFQTFDKKFYSVGSNAKNALGNLTSAARTNVPNRVYFGLEGSDAAPVLESGDISGSTLTTETLVLDYDQSLRQGSYFGRIALTGSDGQQVSLTRTSHLDKVFIQPLSGWTVGEEYTLTIPADAITSVFGVSAPALTMTFTAGEGSAAAPEVTPEDPGSEDTGSDETTTPDTTIPDSDVVNETQVNPDAPPRDYWTAEKVSEAWADYMANGINPYFHGNAIINRLNRENKVEAEWLRITGASSSDYQEVSITGNYWGTDSKTMVGHQIVDFDDYQSLLNLNEGDFLTEAPENVWPFVTNAWLTVDGKTVTVVGNETVTFHVTFNRDMDTSIPLDVRFGSAYPYADYQVEGQYVNARTWEGTMKLNTLIEGGYHCFSVDNGRAADETHKTLYKDWGRFPFQIDTIAANAMSLQASATNEGIQLTWMQDDYAPATMAGYNIYRAESEDGLYTRINPTVIPVGEETFLDDNVEPGKVYYYNFTVALSDASESQPSGKIRVMSKDTLAPTLAHTPVNTALAGSNLTISALATDNLSLQKVSLFYRTVGETTWKEKAMANLNDKYSAIIGSNEVTTAGIQYYIVADDGVSKTTKGSADAPYTIVVQAPVDGSGKGDVDGDGAVTILDAYMVLRAVNGLENLNELQFDRANLDGDDRLSAAEALTILKYANGEIGSLDVTF